MSERDSQKPVVLDGPGLPTIQALIDALPFYVMLLDKDHRILAANQATNEVLGVAQDSLVCQFCPKVVHKQDGPYEGCPLEEAVATGNHVEREIYETQLDCWFLSSVSPSSLRTPEGQQVYLHFTQDITEKQTASRDLARSLEHHRVIAAIVQQIQTCRSAGHVLEVVIDQILALSWIGLTGSAAGFVVDDGELRMTAHRNLPPSVAQSCATLPVGHCLCGKVAEEGKPLLAPCVSEEHVVRHAAMAGHGHVVLPLKHLGQVLAVVNFYLPEGERLDDDRLGFLETVAAISAVALHRLQMQTQLAQSDRMASLGLLASVVAHEIRTPLNALSINAQLISRKINRDGEVDRQAMMGLIDGLQTEIQRINNQIEDHLLAILRHTSTRLRPVQLNDIVNETVGFMSPEAEFGKIKLTCDLNAPLPLVKADPNKLRRVLLNIILNAIQAMRDGGTIRLSTYTEDKHVVVSIQDDGPGISRELGPELDKVFLPFLTTKPDGTGLGLAICARLIRDMQGTIQVHSEPGHGARFDVSLRRHQEGD